MSNICIGLGKRVIVLEVQGWVVDLAENGLAVSRCDFYGRMACGGGTSWCISHVPVRERFDRVVDCLRSKFWACQLQSTKYVAGLESRTAKVSFGGLAFSCGSQWRHYGRSGHVE